MSVTSLNRRAVYNPQPLVEVDGQARDRVSRLILAMDMREREGGLSALELRLSNIASDPQGGAGYAFEDEADLRLGSTITVSAGDVSDPQEIFRGVITALEAEFPESEPPELLVLAEDRLQRARMARRSHTYRDMSVADVVRQVASQIDLRAEVSGLDRPVGTWVQLNESDLAFVRRLLRRVDADVQVVGDVLEAAPRSDVQRNLIEIEMFHDLRSVRFIADLAEQVTQVTATGWNALGGQRVSGIASGLNLGPGEGRRGADILERTLGARSEHVGRAAVTTDDEAQALADTVFDRRARGFVRAQGTATGHPGIRVGTHLGLRGVSRRFENTYFVVATHHRYDVQEGYRTDFEAECARMGEAG